MKISQREARSLRKRLAELERQEQVRLNGWARGMLYMDEDSAGSIQTHQNIVERIFKTGEAGERGNDDE
jgi:hypothetical protein